MIAWEKFYMPKSHGGLGVLDILAHNQALLMKFLHKFLNKDSPRVNIIWETYYSANPPSEKAVGSFWWRDVLKLMST